MFKILGGSWSSDGASAQNEDHKANPCQAKDEQFGAVFAYGDGYRLSRRDGQLLRVGIAETTKVRFDGVETVNARHLFHPSDLFANVVHPPTRDKHGRIAGSIDQKNILAVEPELQNGPSGGGPGVECARTVDETVDDLDDGLPVTKLVRVRVKVPTLSRLGTSGHNAQEEEAGDDR